MLRVKSEINFAVLLKIKNHDLRRDFLFMLQICQAFLMHLVHNVFLTKRPFSITETFCKFGLNVRLVARCEKERL
ncbi:MAG: hypothetical protein UZ14_CFX002002356 [Chloroflexi bacterium OLB14]|nr:MAG: hypothetical protein UZ14_CFX002002356 [Chloroflexi bacterium OLB14]